MCVVIHDDDDDDSDNRSPSNVSVQLWHIQMLGFFFSYKLKVEC